MGLKSSCMGREGGEGSWTGAGQELEGGERKKGEEMSWR